MHERAREVFRVWQRLNVDTGHSCPARRYDPNRLNLNQHRETYPFTPAGPITKPVNQKEVNIPTYTSFSYPNIQYGCRGLPLYRNGLVWPTPVV